MKPLDLKEFAEDMRRKGDIRDADLADEILALVGIEEEVAEPYSDLCEQLNWDVPDGLKDKPEKALEYLRDRSNLLADIEKELEASTVLPKTGANGLPISRDTDDAIKELLRIITDAEAILEAAGCPGNGDFIDGIQALADRPAPMRYDL